MLNLNLDLNVKEICFLSSVISFCYLLEGECSGGSSKFKGRRLFSNTSKNILKFLSRKRYSDMKPRGLIVKKKLRSR